LAGLADLLGPVGQAAFDTLMPLQRHAIDLALTGRGVAHRVQFGIQAIGTALNGWSSRDRS